MRRAAGSNASRAGGSRGVQAGPGEAVHHQGDVVEEAPGTRHSPMLLLYPACLFSWSAAFEVWQEYPSLCLKNF